MSVKPVTSYNRQYIISKIKNSLFLSRHLSNRSMGVSERRARLILQASLALVVLLTPATSSAHEFKAGSILVDHPSSRPTSGSAKIGVGYLRIVNSGADADRLVGGSSTASERLELHTSQVVDGVARMRPLEGGLAIPPGETVDLRSGATHVMLVGLKRPLAAGDTFEGELVFEKAGKVSVEFKVEPFGKAAAASHEGHAR